MALSDPARAILVVLSANGPMHQGALERRVPGARELLPALKASGQVVLSGKGWTYVRGL